LVFTGERFGAAADSMAGGRCNGDAGEGGRGGTVGGVGEEGGAPPRPDPRGRPGLRLHTPRVRAVQSPRPMLKVQKKKVRCEAYAMWHVKELGVWSMCRGWDWWRRTMERNYKVNNNKTNANGLAQIRDI